MIEVPALIVVLATSQTQAQAVNEQADHAALLAIQQEALDEASSKARDRKVAERRKAAKRKAAEIRKKEQARVSRPAREQKPAPAQKHGYPNNLDGWIREALAVMQRHGIPGTYEGIRRNIIRESGGNPRAINLTDSNAARGTPSKGLLQVIQPTFDAYHVEGTEKNLYDPVANIVAACNYAAHTYGTIDNVNGAY